MRNNLNPDSVDVHSIVDYFLPDQQAEIYAIEIAILDKMKLSAGSHKGAILTGAVTLMMPMKAILFNIHNWLTKRDYSV